MHCKCYSWTNAYPEVDLLLDGGTGRTARGVNGSGPLEEADEGGDARRGSPVHLASRSVARRDAGPEEARCAAPVCHRCALGPPLARLANRLPGAYRLTDAK